MFAIRTVAAPFLLAAALCSASAWAKGTAKPAAKPADMKVASVKLEWQLASGEVFDDITNENEGALVVRVEASGSLSSFIKGRKLELVVTQSGKEMGRKSVELEGGSGIGKRRFLFTFTGTWESCADITVTATISGQAKDAVKKATFALECGD